MRYSEFCCQRPQYLRHCPDILPARLDSLTLKQEQLLSALTDFIDNKLLRFSHEKRGVAMRLTTEIVRLCPAEYIPVLHIKV